MNCILIMNKTMEHYFHENVVKKDVKLSKKRRGEDLVEKTETDTPSELQIVTTTSINSVWMNAEELEQITDVLKECYLCV